MDVMLNDGLAAMRLGLKRLGPEADPRKRLERAAELACRCSGNNRARATALLWYAIEVDPKAVELAFARAMDDALAPVIEAARDRVAKADRG